MASWSGRANLILCFKDKRLIQLGKRLITFYAQELLTKEEQATFDLYIKGKWASEDESVKWMTVNKVEEQLKELEDEGIKKGILDSLKAFYSARLDAKGLSANL